MVKIFAEEALAYRIVQIVVGGAYQVEVDFLRISPTQRLNAAQFFLISRANPVVRA
jgi:hypothetical protein